MMFVRTLVLCTKSYNEMTVLTPRVEEIVLESGVQEGMVTVLTRHTTTGVTVNEALECLESDIQTALALFAPEERSYCHARMLRDYGSTAVTHACCATTARRQATPPGISKPC